MKCCAKLTDNMLKTPSVRNRLKSEAGDQHGEYNLPTSIVQKEYDGIVLIFGTTVLIGGRAVNMLSQGTFRKTPDIDLLVQHDISPARLSMMEANGWDQDDSGEKDGKHHFRKTISHEGIEMSIAADINTLKGKDALSSLDKHEIMKRAIPISTQSGSDSEMLVASPEALIAMKFSAIENMKYTANRQESVDVIKHMEDIYRLFSEYYKSDQKLFKSHLKKIKPFFKDSSMYERLEGSIDDIIDAGRVNLSLYSRKAARLTEVLNAMEEGEESRVEERSRKSLESMGQSVRFNFMLSNLRSDEKRKDSSMEGLLAFRTAQEFFSGNVGEFGRALYSIVKKSGTSAYPYLRGFSEGEFMSKATKAVNEGSEAMPELVQRIAASSEIYSTAVKIIFKKETGEGAPSKGELAESSALLKEHWGSAETYLKENWDSIVAGSDRFFQIEDGKKISITKKALAEALESI